MDCHVVEKHREKIEKYLVLAVEFQTLWNTRIEIIIIIIIIIIIYCFTTSV